MIKQLRALFNPELYHGWGKKKKFFEGWYYKIINADESKAFAIIPGIAMDINGHKQAFIQILDGIKRTAENHIFHNSDFVSDGGKCNIQISRNQFTSNKIVLD